MLEVPNFKQATGDLIESILSTCPQWVAWAKADAARAGRFLHTLDGKISDLTLHQLMHTRWALHGVRDPWADLADAHRLALAGMPASDEMLVVKPYSLSSMLSNGEGGILSTVRAGRGVVKLLDDAERIVCDFLHEPFAHLKSGGPVIRWHDNIPILEDPRAVGIVSHGAPPPNPQFASYATKCREAKRKERASKC